MQFKKMLAAGVALAIAAASSVTTADARHRNNNFPLAAGAFGFAAGALIGSALSGPRYHYYGGYDPYYYDAPVYYRPAPRVYYAPAPRVYYDEPPVYYRQAPAYNNICDTPGSKPAWAMC